MENPKITWIMFILKIDWLGVALIIEYSMIKSMAVVTAHQVKLHSISRSPTHKPHLGISITQPRLLQSHISNIFSGIFYAALRQFSDDFPSGVENVQLLS